MTIAIQRADDRFHTDIDWLDSKHSFNFGGHYREGENGHGLLLVNNDDKVAAGGGFGTHGHRDMEIVTFVLDGELEHKDSLGTGSIIRPGELQRMTAGTGVLHSEFNPSRTEPVHLYQIWLFPERKGLTPGYEQRSFPAEEKQGKWRLIASRDGRDGALTVHQDAELSLAVLRDGREVSHEVKPGRAAWLQVLRGSVTADGQVLKAGDGAAWDEPAHVSVRGQGDAEVLLFDLA